MMRPHNIPTTDKPSVRARVRAFGRMRLSRETERTLFFILTLSMLILGLLAKMGIW